MNFYWFLKNRKEESPFFKFNQVYPADQSSLNLIFVCLTNSLPFR